MGFLSWLFGSGIGGAATGIADAVDRFVETPDEKRAAEVIRAKMQQEPDKWQVEVNKVEAAHKTIFVAGWRPAIGWICAFALAWGWIVGPTIQFIWPGRELPAIEIGQAISLVMAMLGMGALRSYEKKHNLTN